MYRVIVLFYGLIVLYKWDCSFHVINFSASAFPCSLFKVMSRCMSGHMSHSVLEQLGRAGVFGSSIFASGTGPAALWQVAAACPWLHSNVCGGDSFTWGTFLPDLGGAQLHPPSGLLWATSSHFSCSAHGSSSLSSEPLYQNSKLPLMPNRGS